MTRIPEAARAAITDLLTCELRAACAVQLARGVTREELRADLAERSRRLRASTGPL